MWLPTGSEAAKLELQSLDILANVIYCIYQNVYERTSSKVRVVYRHLRYDNTGCPLARMRSASSSSFAPWALASTLGSSDLAHWLSFCLEIPYSISSHVFILSGLGGLS
jgi:hypothetical protein